MSTAPDAQVQQDPPPLPVVKAGLVHIVGPVTVLWFLMFVVLLFFTDDLAASGNMIWLWTSLSGWVLGLIGLGIYFWQRAAASRGSRSASTVVLDPDL